MGAQVTEATPNVDERANNLPSTAGIDIAITTAPSTIGDRQMGALRIKGT